MKTLLFAASVLTLATAGVAQVPPVSSTAETDTQPTTGEQMPADSSPLDPLNDETMTQDSTVDPANEPTTREGMAPAMPTVPPTTRSPVTAPSAPTTRPAPMDNMGQPRTAPQPNPVNNPQPVRNTGATQTAPNAAPASTGAAEYQVCTREVTDRCVNPSDIRRGIATRPTRR